MFLSGPELRLWKLKFRIWVGGGRRSGTVKVSWTISGRSLSCFTPRSFMKTESSGYHFAMKLDFAIKFHIGRFAIQLNFVPYLFYKSRPKRKEQTENFPDVWEERQTWVATARIVFRTRFALKQRTRAVRNSWLHVISLRADSAVMRSNRQRSDKKIGRFCSSELHKLACDTRIEELDPARIILRVFPEWNLGIILHVGYRYEYLLWFGFTLQVDGKTDRP